MTTLLMLIDGFSIGGLVLINGYYINGYWWLFY
jgi:hypothetical protein